MFCPKCGEGEQKTNSYCRRCGALSADSSERFFLLNGLFGGGNIERQINVNIFVSLTTTIISGALMGFLLGYYEAEPSTPKIIYLVYVFISLIAVWQILSVIVSLQLKSKFGQRGQSEDAISNQTASRIVQSAATDNLLPEAKTRDLIKPSVIENTTQTLKEKVNR